MKVSRVVLSFALAMLIALPLMAGEGKKGKKAEKKAPPCPAAEAIKNMTKGLTLTADQKTKLEAIGKEFGPKIVEARKGFNVLTPEQKKAQGAAAKEAKAAGKKGKEFQEAVSAAVKLTDEQKAKQAVVKKEVDGLYKGLREEVMKELTADQKDQLKKAHAAKKHEGKKAK